jgi:oligopeptide/dipeptide ABC transporter ATP-binding protein
MRPVVLDVKSLCIRFRLKEGVVNAVDGVSYRLHAGETLGLVGESGCGKTVSSLAVLKLLEVPPAEYGGGEVLFEGLDLLRADGRTMRRVRGRSIAMIFQEPMTSLNPMIPIGPQVGEVLVAHGIASPREAAARAVELLDRVGIPSPRQRAADYPHQLSGGMRQRAMIALALACNPKVLIADEPTTALDVTIQAQILDLMLTLQAELGTSILMITHDMGVIAETADRVAVMYAGRIVEEAGVHAIFKHPLHPYTQSLLRCIPRIDAEERPRRLAEIPGRVPDLGALPPGCAFGERCPVKDGRCREAAPALVSVGDGHRVGCWAVQRSG